MATLILVGHGSSCDSGAGAPVRAHAARIRAPGIFRHVRPAFWRETPHVRDVLAATADHEVVIVPMFMSDGYFAGQVLPRALGLERPVTLRGSQRIHYTSPVGTHPGIPALIERRAREAGAGPGSAVLVVGHGTDRHALSDDSTWAAVHALRARGRFGAVAAAFLEEEPRIARAIEPLEADQIVVVPFFLADGDHTTRDIPAGLAGAGARGRIRQVTITPPVGTLPEIAGLAAELALAAAGERGGESRRRGRWLAEVALGDGSSQQREANDSHAAVDRAADAEGGSPWVPSTW